MTTKQSLNFIRDRRKRELLDADRLHALLLETQPEYYELEKQIRSLRLDVLKGKGDENELAKLREKRLSFLQKKGIRPEMLEPAPHCEICNDSGVTSNGYCRCVIAHQTTADTTLFSFEESNFDLFGEEGELAKRVYAIMQKYCAKFPEVNKNNVVIVGKCGSGKSYLATAMADCVLKKGYTCFLTTAFGFINDMLKYHTAPLADKAEIIFPYLDCDMLVIDDLGSETKLNNVSEEYLYLVLNERMAKKRSTVITTNLDYEQISARYGERIASRLFDKNNSIVTSVSNTDLRKR